MIRAAALAVLLAGCAAPTVPSDLRSCANQPPTPASLRRVHTHAEGGAFAIRLELAREAERARGDECADKLQRLNEWMKR